MVQRDRLREIVRMRELNMPLLVMDIAGLAAQYFHDKGVKVWRWFLNWKKKIGL